jgi:hypothetical protein
MPVPEFSSLGAITVDSVKTYFGIDSADTGKNAMIAPHLAGVISYLQEICGHDFLSITRTEKPIIKPYENAFYVDNYPIASVTSVIEYGVTLTENTDFFVDAQSGRIEKINTTNSLMNPDRDVAPYWNSVRGNVVIVYVGGTAITDNVIRLVKEMVGISSGLKKRTYVDNQGITQVATLTSLPSDLKAIVDFYNHARVGHV